MGNGCIGGTQNKRTNRRLKKALKKLYSFIDYERLVNPEPFDTSVFDLDRFRKGLAERGNPHTRYPSVLIAGSKGKGSVASMVESVLRNAGYSTGLYTSPHLVDTKERIRINGLCLPDDRFAAKIEELADIAVRNDEAKSYRTVFEILTAAAFELFAEYEVDIAVVEAGMGGHLDATNVLEPAVSVITTVGLDHTNVLGDTLDKIAAEKAGIMRAGVPAIIGPQTDTVTSVLRGKAADIGAGPILEFGKEIEAFDIKPSRSGCDFSVRLQESGFENLNTNLIGRYQVENGVVAVATVEALRNNGFSIPENAIRDGLYRVLWPGRIQLFAGNPALVVDGAHSPISVSRLVEAIRELWPGVRPVFIFAANRDKDISKMLDGISSIARCIILTRFDWPRAAETQYMKGLLPEGNFDIHLSDTVSEALCIAEKIALPDELVVATGSLYLAGEVLRLRGFCPCEYFRENIR